MRKTIRIASLLLSVVLLCGTCSCAVPDEFNPVWLDAEVMIGNVVVMINSEEEIFRDEIGVDDIETYVRYFGDAEEKPVELVNVTFQSAQKIGINFHLNKDIDTVEVKVKKSGTTTGKEYVGATQDLAYSGINGEKDVLKGIDEIKKMLTKGTFSTLMDYGMSGVSACMSAYSVLKILGYVKDVYLDTMERILNNVKVVEDSVDALDKKVDTVYTGLKAELDKINVTTKRTLRNTYAQQWSDFKTQYVNTNGGLREQIDTVGNLYAANFCAYSSKQSGTFRLYYDENGVPAIPENEKASPMKSLEGNLIDPSKTVSFVITESTFEQSNAMRIKAIDDEKYMELFRSELRAALLGADGVTEENADTVTEDAMSVISALVMMDTLNAKGKNGTVADDLIDSYTRFCKKLCDTTSNPLDAYHYLITSNYNFQTEAAADLQAFNNYILALAAEGRAYCDLAAQLGSVKQSKKTAIETCSEELAAFVENHSGFRSFDVGTQYCYVTESCVTAAQYTAKLQEEIKCHLGVMVFYTTGNYDSSDFKLTWEEQPSGVISTSDLQEIYATYKVLRANGLTNCADFSEYFLTQLAMTSKNWATFESMDPVGILSGSSFGKRAFSLDGTMQMKAYSDVFSARTNKKAGVHAPCDFFTTGKTYSIGKEFDDSDADKGYFTEHSSIFADVMDMKTERFYHDTPLLSGAIYVQSAKRFIVDELWEFASVADLTDQEKWSNVKCTAAGDPTYDPQHPFGDIRDYMIDNSTHGADPLYYYLNASATFWAIVSE